MASLGKLWQYVVDEARGMPMNILMERALASKWQTDRANREVKAMCNRCAGKGTWLVQLRGGGRQTLASYMGNF